MGYDDLQAGFLSKVALLFFNESLLFILQRPCGFFPGVVFVLVFSTQRDEGLVFANDACAKLKPG